MQADKIGALTNTKAEQAFIKTGMRNWKKGLEKFKDHEKSDSHREATIRVVTGPAQHQSVNHLLSPQSLYRQYQNRQMLIKVLESVRFLCRQGLALRGNWDKESGSELNANFNQLLKLLGSHNEYTSYEWLEKKNFKYTSPQMQNEMLNIMSNTITREVASAILKSKYYVIMADETADASNQEQLVVCIGYGLWHHSGAMGFAIY